MVSDTVIGGLLDVLSSRLWCYGNYPKTAVFEFSRTH
ncbi:MAG: hypothetical protein LBH02_02960 [Methanocalculaceae archaeon]|nr:hypothetical protein [Methanocalculaceae archaeon]